MYESGTPAKQRKLSEFRDPDYEQQNATNSENNSAATITATCENSSNLSTTIQESSATSQETEKPTCSKQALEEDIRIQRTRGIIEREFQREINYHQEKLKEVDKSLEEAFKIFDKLRYTLVANYYRKQEVEISANEAAKLRGENTLFTNEPKGPQLPLHPALKKFIGKRPSYLAEVMRVPPKRTAAQNAIQKIDEVTNSLSNKQKRREERRLQKLIRDKGIVIDHSKDEADNLDQAFALERAKLLSQSVAMEQAKPQINLSSTPQVALNVTRLNNKVKHLIVVGNTSQYIGDENMTQQGSSSGQRISHKWLVYVQAKDPESTPLERLIEKIRFYLHASYRPNDVVDIHSPPFQLSRRGWGEFPIRLQIFFNDNLQQKPVQLVHNLVLDKTLCGMQTMGAETLVEVWLRPLPKSTHDHDNALFQTKNDNEDESENSRKRTFSLGLGLGPMRVDMDDDNLLDFLNRIEATPSSLSSDIEKLEPTVNLNESFSSSVTSPEKISKQSSPLKNNNQHTASMHNFDDKLNKTDEVISSIKPNITTTTMPSPSKLKNTRFGGLKILPQPATPKPLIICLNTNSNTATTSTPSTVSTPAIAPLPSQNTKIVQLMKPNAITLNPNATSTTLKPVVRTYEKKMVKLVDAKGNIKYVPMLVAKVQNSTNQNNVASATTTTATTTTATPSTAKTTTTTTMINSSVNRPNKIILPFSKTSPNIFLKEGKLCIRDPQQIKLKQQQKQQTSLLKPQVSLLKPQQPIVSKTPKSTNFLKTPRKTLSKTIKLVEPEKDERAKLEEAFQRLNFRCVRAAIEFLLRRVPLFATNHLQLVKEFAFVCCQSELKFQELPALKQRACEWQRAKYISECLPAHVQLKQLVQDNEFEVFWSTKEIVLFARLHAYTPPIKCLTMISRIKEEKPEFSEILRKEVISAKDQVQYETLSTNEPILAWLEDMSTKFKTAEAGANNEVDVDVVKVAEAPCQATAGSLPNNTSDCETLAVPRHLEASAELVQEICRSLKVPLQTEEVADETRQPLAKIVLAQCVRVFLEQLVRRAVATQNIEPSHQPQELKECDLPTVKLQDIGKALVEFGQPAEETTHNYVYSEYDFLTNCYLGISQPDNESDDEEEQT